MNDKEKFIADLYPAATKISQETGMSRDLILAQAAAETGWGAHVLPGTNNIYDPEGGIDWPATALNRAKFLNQCKGVPDNPNNAAIAATIIAKYGMRAL